jgi:hypothetical protein
MRGLLTTWEFCFLCAEAFAIQSLVMYRRYTLLVLLCLTAWGIIPAQAEDYSLTDGTVLSGEAISFNDKGVVVKLNSGAYSDRVPWTKFTQEALKEFVKIAKAREFAEPYIELPAEEKQKAKLAEIKIQPVPRVERPTKRPGLFAAMTTPGGMVILLVLFLANLYAAYEIAVFRNQPTALVCAVSAFVPVVGPIIFLSLPRRELFLDEPLPMTPEEAPAGEPQVEASAQAAPAGHGSLTGRIKKGLSSMLPGKPAGGLSVRRESKAGAAGAQAGPRIFRRGEVEFSRRFIETQFSGFFRIVPTEAEKDLLLFIKTAKNEYVGKRISRMTGNEMHVQLQTIGKVTEIGIPFEDIVEIQVRHKDHKG